MKNVKELIESGRMNKVVVYIVVDRDELTPDQVEKLINTSDINRLGFEVVVIEKGMKSQFNDALLCKVKKINKEQLLQRKARVEGQELQELLNTAKWLNDVTSTRFENGEFTILELNKLLRGNRMAVVKEELEVMYLANLAVKIPNNEGRDIWKMTPTSEAFLTYIRNLRTQLFTQVRDLTEMENKLMIKMVENSTSQEIPKTDEEVLQKVPSSDDYPVNQD